MALINILVNTVSLPARKILLLQQRLSVVPMADHLTAGQSFQMVGTMLSMEVSGFSDLFPKAVAGRQSGPGNAYHPYHEAEHQLVAASFQFQGP